MPTFADIGDILRIYYSNQLPGMNPKTNTQDRSFIWIFSKKVAQSHIRSRNLDGISRYPDPEILDFLIFGIIQDPGFFQDLSLGIPPPGVRLFKSLFILNFKK